MRKSVDEIVSDEHRIRSREYIELELARRELWFELLHADDETQAGQRPLQNEQQLNDATRDHEPGLRRMHRIFGLNRRAADLLLCCVAPSLSTRFDAKLLDVSAFDSPDVTPALLAKIFDDTPEWS